MNKDHKRYIRKDRRRAKQTGYRREGRRRYDKKGHGPISSGEGMTTPARNNHKPFTGSIFRERKEFRLKVKIPIPRSK